MRTFYKTIAVLALVLAPAAVAAQTVDTSALLAQIARLQQQIAAQLNTGNSGGGGGGGGGGTSGGNCVTLDTNLSKGDSGDDVTDLQNFLIKEGVLDTNATWSGGGRYREVRSGGHRETVFSECPHNQT